MRANTEMHRRAREVEPKRKEPNFRYKQVDFTAEVRGSESKTGNEVEGGEGEEKDL